MRKLRSIEHISLDGVIQVSGDDGNFPYGDWTVPSRTAAGRDAMLAAHGERFDLVLGRRTYDAWSGFWPNAPSSPIADRLNVRREPRHAHSTWSARTPCRPESSSVGTRSSGL